MFGKKKVKQPEKPIVQHTETENRRDTYWADIDESERIKLQPTLELYHRDGNLTAGSLYVNETVTYSNGKRGNDGLCIDSLDDRHLRALMWLLAHLSDDVKQKIGLVESP